MNEKSRFINAKRRGFLQGTVVAGGVVATAVAAAEPTEADTTQALVKPHKSAGYRLTDQVRMYYAKARF